MNKYFIAIDLGATSGRVILAECRPDGISMETVRRFPNTIENKGGRLYWNFTSLFNEIVAGLESVATKGVTVESIGVDTWGVDFVFVGKDGKILGEPRSYRDPYTDGIPEEVFGIMPRKEVFGRTGIQIMNFNTLFQLYAMKKEGSVPAEADKLLFLPDAISYLLCGEMVCERTILSTSQMMNARTGEPDADLVNLAGFSTDIFPKTVQPGTVIGGLTEEIARKTGLPEGLPVVAVAGHDTGSAVAAVPAGNRNFAYLSSGTWSLMGLELDHCLINENSFENNYTNEGGVDGTVRYLKNITGMWLLEQCRAQWKKEGRDYSYPEIVDMAVSAAPSENLIDPDAPEFAAPENMLEAICALMKAKGQKAPGSDAEMIRLIFDSLAGKYAFVLNKLREVAPFPIDTLHVIGGGSQNDLLNSMTAEACGIKVVAGPVEATALGNVLMQARAAGVVSKDNMKEYIRKSINTKTYLPK